MYDLDDAVTTVITDANRSVQSLTTIAAPGVPLCVDRSWGRTTTMDVSASFSVDERTAEFGGILDPPISSRPVRM